MDWADEKAKELRDFACKQNWKNGGVHVHDVDEAEQEIAAALRAARDAGLEEAAMYHFNRHAELAGQAVHERTSGHHEAAAHCFLAMRVHENSEERIRTLKSEGKKSEETT